jgi:hypothetical protein
MAQLIHFKVPPVKHWHPYAASLMAPNFILPTLNDQDCQSFHEAHSHLRALVRVYCRRYQESLQHLKLQAPMVGQKNYIVNQLIEVIFLSIKWRHEIAEEAASIYDLADLTANQITTSEAFRERDAAMLDAIAQNLRAYFGVEMTLANGVANLLPTQFLHKLNILQEREFLKLTQHDKASGVVVRCNGLCFSFEVAENEASRIVRGVIIKANKILINYLE